MKAGNLWIAGTHIGGQVVEGDEVLAYRAALIGIVDTSVRIPDLAICTAVHLIAGQRAGGRIYTLPAAVKGKGDAGIWIRPESAQFAEVSCALQGTGHPGIFRHRSAGAATFVVKEEEGTVLTDRSADRDTELVPAHRRNLHAGGV